MEIDEEFESYSDYTDKDRTRGNRRKQDYRKALSKHRKDVSRGENFSSHPWYSNIHQYSKNKIHCSCLLCSFNGRKHGRIVYKARTASDMRKDESIKQKLDEYSRAS